MQGAPVSPTASASGSDLDLPDIAVHEEPLCNSPYQYSAEELAKLYRDAQAEIEKHQAASRYFEQELAAAKHDTMFFRSAANDKDNQIRKLREQLDQSQSEVKMLKPENAELRKTCSKLQLQKDSAADKLSDAKRELSDIHQKLQREVTDRKQAQQQLDVLTQHFSDEEVRKGGSCSVAIKFDTQQRQQLYTHAVRTLLQPIEDKYALGVEVVQTATACNFLLYVTFSSTDRLVNFDEAAFERFKQQCSVENAVILVVHRNQADLPCVPSILKDENYKSGLRLGRHDQTLHMLQINAFGEGPVELLADSDVNEKNHQELFKLLQMVLPLTERRASRSLLQRLFGR